MNVTDKIRLHHVDCMEFMRGLPDKYYDLGIIDIPYGIDADKKNNGPNSKSHSKNSKAKINTYKEGWDSETPPQEFFNELFRVTNRQIIWGANYVGLTGGYLYWHKNVTMPTYSQGELAWLSWLNKIDFFELTWHGMLQHDMKNKETRIHPTQKPVALYKWILDKYAKQGDKILDTHGGSMSIAIACHDYGFELDLCELDAEYYAKGVERVQNHVKQLKMF
jgi:site-specific DNA-methyltransferase (adenine-specific)